VVSRGVIAIASQIGPDGRQPLELARAGSPGNSVFNVTAQFMVARLSAGLGADLLHYTTPKGASLARAVEYLLLHNGAPANGRETRS
jgi:hypothetical protein